MLVKFSTNSLKATQIDCQTPELLDHISNKWQFWTSVMIATAFERKLSWFKTLKLQVTFADVDLKDSRAIRLTATHPALMNVN